MYEEEYGRLMNKFRFIDLFSGIGGFHQAMESLGGTCVFASEIDEECNKVYEDNYGLSSDINIRDAEVENIPEHDVLCAGFPCQAFSKAGKQMGLKDQTRGTLFFEIVRILEYHKTPYIVLENVRNLVSHDHGNTWRIIQNNLKELGYRTTAEPLIISPHQFGIPHLRERVIILGKYDPDNIELPLDIKFSGLKKKDSCSIYDVIDKDVADDSYNISDYENYVLTAWDEFYKGIKEKVIGFPIWSFEFKGTYDLEGIPAWKADFIRKNRELYHNNAEFIDKWLVKYDNLSKFSPTHKKMEWQAGDKISSLWEGVIQFRPSGIRVKVPTCFPALVAMVQIPIIGKYKRRLTVEEAARLQSFPSDFKASTNRQQAYKEFGNGVNVEVIRRCAEKLFEQ